MKKTIAISALMLLTLTTFTNCSPYTQTDASSLDALSDLTCGNTPRCVIPVPENLGIKVNLPNNVVQMNIAAGILDFNVGGDCNEGGYPSNVIRWELWDNAQNASATSGQTLVRDSTRSNAESACINGRFSLYINLNNVAYDNYNRGGLMSPISGARGMYTLIYRIYGRDTAGQLQVGPNYQSSMYLQPIM